MIHEYPADAVAALAELLEGSELCWVIGGSTGLSIRGAQWGSRPRDLDIYADEDDMPALHTLLAGCALDLPAESRTGIYRSVLSHYSIQGTLIELVGGFRVESEGSIYRTEVRKLLYPAGDTYVVNGIKVRIDPLAHELVFNVLRRRNDRCELIGQLIREDKDRQFAVLRTMLDNNRLTQATRQRILEFAGVDEHQTEERLE